jgi:hypothetical protein
LAIGRRVQSFFEQERTRVSARSGRSVVRYGRAFAVRFDVQLQRLIRCTFGVFFARERAREDAVGLIDHPQVGGLVAGTEGAVIG